MVPRDEWLEQMKTHFGDETAPISKMWGHFTRDQLPQTADGEPLDWFVHLVDARYVAGPASVPAEGGLRVRVRMSEVDSWVLTVFGSEVNAGGDPKD